MRSQRSPSAQAKQGNLCWKNRNPQLKGIVVNCTKVEDGNRSGVLYTPEKEKRKERWFKDKLRRATMTYEQEN